MRCVIPRIRYIKPEFWKDEDIAELSHQLRLFYIGLWNFADKSGRLEDRPKWLKVEIFPYENANVEKMLTELAKPKSTSLKPFIQRYEYNGKKYIQILAWPDHQKPHHQEQDSKIPDPPNNINTLTETEKGTGTIMGMGSVENADHLSTAEQTPNKHRTTKEEATIKAIIDDLNLILDTNYKYSTKTTVDLIKERLKEGHTLEDFKIVHRKKFTEWSVLPNMQVYLRPITLYSKKFEGYLNQKEKAPLSESGMKALQTAKEFIKEND